jgi:hypothetical protein
MAKGEISTKRLAIVKANARMVGIVAAASFVTVFCLVASKAVLSQNQYQARVISEKEKAHSQLQKNIKAFNDLAAHYKAWNATSTNVIGGVSTGTGDNDGTNAKIILDSLPSSYDFPALTASLEKILTDHGFKGSISGTDDELSQQSNTASPNPTPVEIPFSFSVDNASYGSVNQLISLLEHSIRPIQVDSLDLSGGSSNMTVNVKAHTYYQPGKSLTITQKVVK